MALVRRIGVVLCCSVFLQILAPPILIANNSNFRMELSPANLTVDYGDSESPKFSLTIKNDGEQAIEALLQAALLMHTDGKDSARVQFQKNQGVTFVDKNDKERVKVNLLAKTEQGASQQIILFKVVRVDRSGSYNGQIVLLDQTTRQKLAETEIHVTKSERSLNVSIQGLEKDMPITLDPLSAGQTKFTLILKNDGEYRHRLKIDPFTLSSVGGDLTGKVPETFSMEAKSQESITLEFENDTNDRLWSRSYKGYMVVRDKDVPDLKQIFEVKVIPPPLKLMIREQENSKTISLTARAKGEREFAIHVRMESGPDRIVNIEPVSLRGTDRVLTSQAVPQFRLEGTEWHEIVLRFGADDEDMPSSGTYKGELAIKDLGFGGQRARFSLELVGNYATDKPVWILIIVVFSGSVISLLLSILLPRLLRKINLRQKIKDFEEQVANLSRFEDPQRGNSTLLLRNKMEVDFARLRQAINKIKVRSNEFADRIAEIDTLLAGFSQTIKLVVEIGRLRQKIWLSKGIAFSLREQFANDLNQVQWYLIDGNLDVAKQQLDTLKARLEDQAFLDAYRSGVVKKIDERLKPLTGGNLTDEQKWINGLISRLGRFVVAKEIPEDQFLEVDRIYAVVDLYLHDLRTLENSRPLLKSDQRLKILEHLKGGLASDHHIVEARELIQSLQTGISLESVETAACGATEGGRLVLSSTDPKAGSLVWAWFQFHNAKFEERSDLSGRLDYLWDFGDDTRLTGGKKCVHFFGEDQEGKTLAITVKVISSDNKSSRPYRLENIKVMEVARKTWEGTMLETTAFFLTFIIASLVGVSVQFEQMSAPPPEAITLYEQVKTYLPAFIWGFTLDQAKGGFLSAFKAIPGRESAKAS